MTGKQLALSRNVVHTIAWLTLVTLLFVSPPPSLRFCFRRAGPAGGGNGQEPPQLKTFKEFLLSQARDDITAQEAERLYEGYKGVGAWSAEVCPQTYPVPLTPVQCSLCYAASLPPSPPFPSYFRTLEMRLPDTLKIKPLSTSGGSKMRSG